MEKENINLVAIQLGSKIGCIEENLCKAEILLEKDNSGVSVIGQMPNTSIKAKRYTATR